MGAAQVFGTFARTPFSHILAERLPCAVLNLGIGGAGPKRFVDDPVLLRTINAGRVAVIQVMSGRSASNSEYEQLQGTSAIRRRGTSEPWRLAEAVYADLADRLSGDTLRRLIEETRVEWSRRMVELAGLVKVPKILLWVSERRPEDYPATLEEEIRGTMQTFPHFITRPIIDELVPHFNEYVEVVTSRGQPHLLSTMKTGRPEYVVRKTGETFCFQRGYLSPEMHEDVATRLLPVLRKYVTRP